MDAKQIKIDREDKVKSILKNLLHNDQHAIVWQHEEDVFERNSIEVKLAKISLDEQQLHITPTNGMFRFHQNEEVYYLNQNKSILFKTTIFHNSAYKIILHRPEMVVIRDQRKQARQHLEHKDIQISYHYGTKTGLSLEKFPFSSKLLDFSNGGLSFGSNLASVKQFMPGDQITIKFNNKNQDIVEAKVAYVNPTLLNGKNIYRVGVSFN